MKLFKIQINKDCIQKIPVEEFLFFIQLTNFANEIFSLQKITFFSTSVEEEDPLIRRAKNSQALFMIRLTAGKLCEGWRLLETHFFNSILSTRYFDQFSDEAKSNLNFLKNYFSKSNLVKTIRDEYAFHYSSESSRKVKEVINKLDEQDKLVLFFSKHHGNCFYDMSDALVNESLFMCIDESSRTDSIKKILTEVVRVTQNYLHFVGECVLVFGNKYLGMDSEEIEIPDQPSLDEIRIPYFVSEVPPEYHR